MSTFLLAIAVLNAYIAWRNYLEAKKNNESATTNLAHAAFLVMINQRLEEMVRENRNLPDAAVANNSDLESNCVQHSTGPVEPT